MNVIELKNYGPETEGYNKTKERAISEEIHYYHILKRNDNDSYKNIIVEDNNRLFREKKLNSVFMN